MDAMDQLLCAEFRKSPPGTPMAQRTVFGWTLFGSVDGIETAPSRLQSLYCDVQLDRALTRLWELEEAPQKTHLTDDERYCEDFFEATHRRAPDGRFVVELPLKSDVPLGDSRNNAVRNLLRLERRFSRDENLRLRYNEFMQELIEMKHMELAPESSNQTFYMPHHPVVKKSSLTTKLRVVFNASAKSATGNSTHRYAVTADIAKMYRQVCVSLKHVDSQRIIWRRDPSLPIQDYRMLRVTYGVAAASHLAVKSLQETAKCSSNVSEKAAFVILNDFYMDDLLTGTASKAELILLQKNVSGILQQGGFELRKWASSCAEFSEYISNASKTISHYLVEGKDVHALGLMWNTEDDFLTFTISMKKPPAALTKITFLSDASTLFDPLGLLAPATIRSKMWFQEIWRNNVGWDDLIPDSIATKWLEHRSELKLISNLKICRWLGLGTTGSSKTKVAPLKTTTLPRRELCAAHLAAKLVRSVLHSWGNPRYPLYAWTDSTITLAWQQDHPSRWITFVANRVADVQEILPPECWNHVRSEMNPADCASRGVTPSELLRQQLWWTGPEFLKGPDQFWKKPSPKHHTTDSKRPIPLRSSLLRLQPYLDEKGVLRVGGRLKNAEVTPDVKHPIVLPKNYPLAKMIICEIHEFTLHAGPRIMQTVLQHRYWVIGARSLIRSIYHKCVKFTLFNRNLATQSMGDLPAARITYARCFTRTAVDFAGPYKYKFTHGRGAKATKGYICSFVCMCTGAMHLEFVGDLSTLGFLNAFKRFINRRGYCKLMTSDNGTNFVGAEKELRSAFQKCMADTRLRSFFADSKIEWRFNPPSAPHMGGYCETGIKRTKYHLKRVLGETLLSYGAFNTLLTEVEACVNSPPLCDNSTSVDDLEALTPGHFLVGEPLKSLPEPEGQGFCGSLRQQWDAISAIRQHFWRRWRDEYLVSLQRRSKWFRSSRNVEEDDVVAIFNEPTPPTKWKMARVIKCHPGTDGLVRVVTLQTPNGELVRPIVKLCVLPTKGDLFCEEDPET
ncbi:PREDICTED: uncharacterized protein LOC108360428 [Rhagoletis zephyria]|uniref:uncharacterized protein LOC108360428 n=1 Tax=Rhagoletis zephyria TaxID=28612 RepID=UPI00081163B5|nr:PREDICTED: uncharacterized protein LOC108360428 [Rhagoletis zephyria]